MCASLFDALLSPSPAGASVSKMETTTRALFPLPPMKEAAKGVLVPDHAAFCPAYWRGCFECPDFLRDRLRFCRKWNRAFHGVDVVELITEGEKRAIPSPLPEPALMEEDTGRSWWTYGRKSQRSVNTVDAKKGEALTA